MNKGESLSSIPDNIIENSVLKSHPRKHSEDHLSQMEITNSEINL